MQKLAELLFILALGTTIAGCSGPKATGYLSDYDRLKKGDFVESYFADRNAIRAGGYTRIELGSVSTDQIQDQKNVSRSECAEWLRDALTQSSSKKPGAAPLVVSSSGTGASAQLDVSITEMTPGNATTRIFIGELGAGHAWVQLEGKVTDPESGAVLATFAERRRASGAIGLKDLKGDSGAALVRGLIKKIAKDVRKELGASFRPK